MPQAAKPQRPTPAYAWRNQIPDAEKAARADFVLENSGDKAHLRAQVGMLWQRLFAESNKSSLPESLKIEAGGRVSSRGTGGARQPYLYRKVCQV